MGTQPPLPSKRSCSLYCHEAFELPTTKRQSCKAKEYKALVRQLNMSMQRRHDERGDDSYMHWKYRPMPAHLEDCTRLEPISAMHFSCPSPACPDSMARPMGDWRLAIQVIHLITEAQTGGTYVGIILITPLFCSHDNAFNHDSFHC